LAERLPCLIALFLTGARAFSVWIKLARGAPVMETGLEGIKMATFMKTAKSKSIDEYIGSRMRAGRLSLNMSQECLAQALGVSFQQIQHYEKGINSVSAVRLFDICEILSVSLSSMFQAHSVRHVENAL
jgi:DNA-binding XRE family transcriptional regulator